MSRMVELVDEYRAETVLTDPEASDLKLKQTLNKIGSAEPKTAEEAELKLQVLLADGVDGIIGAENYPKMVMKAYLRRLMFNF
ncbi:MAG: hypothetical protein ACR2PF_09520 [Rhizobiaceae bacterium]